MSATTGWRFVESLARMGAVSQVHRLRHRTPETTHSVLFVVTWAVRLLGGRWVAAVTRRRRLSILHHPNRLSCPPTLSAFRRSKTSSHRLSWPASLFWPCRHPWSCVPEAYASRVVQRAVVFTPLRTPTPPRISQTITSGNSPSEKSDAACTDLERTPAPRHPTRPRAPSAPRSLRTREPDTECALPLHAVVSRYR